MTNCVRKVRFTPTEKRILVVLADGKPHTREEIHSCLWDELSARSTIQAHLSKMRIKLRPKGEEIVCEFYRKSFYYRHIRLLVQPDQSPGLKA